MHAGRLKQQARRPPCPPLAAVVGRTCGHCQHAACNVFGGIHLGRSRVGEREQGWHRGALTLPVLPPGVRQHPLFLLIFAHLADAAKGVDQAGLVVAARNHLNQLRHRRLAVAVKLQGRASGQEGSRAHSRRLAQSRPGGEGREGACAQGRACKPGRAAQGPKQGTTRPTSQPAAHTRSASAPTCQGTAKCASSSLSVEMQLVESSVQVLSVSLTCGQASRGRAGTGGLRAAAAAGRTHVSWALHMPCKASRPPQRTTPMQSAQSPTCGGGGRVSACACGATAAASSAAAPASRLRLGSSAAAAPAACDEGRAAAATTACRCWMR